MDALIQLAIGALVIVGALVGVLFWLAWTSRSVGVALFLDELLDDDD